MSDRAGFLPNRRTVAERCWLNVSRRIRRARVPQLLNEVMTTPYAPRAEIAPRQFQRLAALLAHAEARVPYYRNMFQSLGIRSADIRNLQDFASLPILTKDIVRQHLTDLVCADATPQRLMRRDTGGSTGVPLSFYRDQLSNDARVAGSLRTFRQCGWEIGEVMAIFEGVFPRGRRWRFAVNQALRASYYFDGFNAGPEQMDVWLKKWRRLKPRIAIGFPSIIACFATHVLDGGRQLPPLRGVFTTGEKLYPHQRALISQVFNCKVYDRYGSSEVGNIASECARGRMHVNADFVLLETDDGANAEGGALPLVVTSLWDFAMPFIRYRNEDYGLLVPGACDCGSNFPLMQLDIARETDFFILPSGRAVHGMFFTGMMFGHEWNEGIANFQFQQIALDTILLRIVPAPGLEHAKERTIRRVLTKIKLLGDPRLKVEVVEVAEIPRTATGKHRYVRSDVTRTALHRS